MHTKLYCIDYSLRKSPVSASKRGLDDMIRSFLQSSAEKSNAASFRSINLINVIKSHIVVTSVLHLPLCIDSRSPTRGPIEAQEVNEAGLKFGKSGSIGEGNFISK